MDNLPTDCLQKSGAVLSERKSRVRLTAGRVADFSCPPGKSQAFLWDTDAPTLAVRVTPTGRKTYVFESRLNRGTIRINIGDVKTWPLDAPVGEKDAKTARREATRLAQMVDSGLDPREVARQEQAHRAAAKAVNESKALTVGDVWPLYLANGRPKRRDAWKPRYRADLEAMASPGGDKKKRGQGTTRQGPLHPLLALPLASIDEDVLKDWFDKEAKASRHQAARALMMFRGFLRWCSGRQEYRSFTDRDAGRSAAILENLPANTRRTDVLESAQMRGWWTEAEQLPNRTAAVYLQALLLTGARREELAALTWANVDFQWRKLTLADKVETSRTIPLTPYLAQLLATLPRVNQFVFASTGKTGRIVDVRSSHERVLRAVGIEHLTFHGLRRANKQRGRSVAPHGAVDQMQGHKPSGTADGYAILPIDDLRPFAEVIEAHILGLAGVVFDAQAEPGKLRAVAS
ncbi:MULTISPECIES: integrase family protein [unclassified Acidovorax]|uniref:integrase family protein n=1 Tax=unclassified Acidovorax TaxID=2684926 RepID=UPI0021075626|nr:MULTISPECIES: integrase family protein [unclassified Acidovorax]